jgi:hypothetical protein
MVSQNVNRIFQEAQTLNGNERQQLRVLLEELAAGGTTPSKWEKARHALVARGLLETQPPRGKDPDRFGRWHPVAVQGKPVSETIIEERR